MKQDMADQDCWQSRAGAAGIELADYVDRLLLAEPRALGRVAARLALAALDPQALRDAKPRFDLLALHDARWRCGSCRSRPAGRPAWCSPIRWRARRARPCRRDSRRARSTWR